MAKTHSNVEKVKKKFPYAYCDAWDGGAIIWPSHRAFDDRPELGRGKTATEAWARAALNVATDEGAKDA